MTTPTIVLARTSKASCQPGIVDVFAMIPLPTVTIQPQAGEPAKQSSKNRASRHDRSVLGSVFHDIVLLVRNGDVICGRLSNTYPKTGLWLLIAQPRRKNRTNKTMTTIVSNPPPMYMVSLPFSNARVSSGRYGYPQITRNKKAGVVEYLEAFDHVGLLLNRPPGRAELPFI
jgi:hypothetical protein